MALARKASGRRKANVSPNDPAELVRVCARLAEDKKAEGIVILDLREMMYVTDYFLIASGTNPRQLQAVRGAIQDEMTKRGVRPIGVEGAQQDRWVLMDYGAFVVHVFDPEWRKLYDLELLWGDAPRVEWQVARPPLRTAKRAGVKRAAPRSRAKKGGGGSIKGSKDTPPINGR